MVFQCRQQKLEFLQWHQPSVGLFKLNFSSDVPVKAKIFKVSSVAFQRGAVSTKFFQWCSSVPCKYSLGRPVVSQCTLGQPVAFQWHSNVHWASQCTLAQGKGCDVSDAIPGHTKLGICTCDILSVFPSTRYNLNQRLCLKPECWA